MSKDDEKVGYGRPPKSAQFKKGQSGNPKGRPKRTYDIKAIVGEELCSTVTIREGDSTAKIHAMRAAVKGTLAKAIRGDLKSLTWLLDNSPREILEDTAQPNAEGLAAKKYIKEQAERAIHSSSGIPSEYQKETRESKGYDKDLAQRVIDELVARGKEVEQRAQEARPPTGELGSSSGVADKISDAADKDAPKE